MTQASFSAHVPVTHLTITDLLSIVKNQQRYNKKYVKISLMPPNDTTVL